VKSFDGVRKINKKNKISRDALGSSKKSLVKDPHKRNFIKLAGIAGVGALAYSLIPKKAQALIFGSSMRTDSVGIKNVANSQIDPSTEAKQDDIITAIGGFQIPPFDEVLATYPDTSTEVYTYRKSSSTVGVVTVVYSDAITKQTITSVTLT
jgi:hypothetical protein